MQLLSRQRYLKMIQGFCLSLLAQGLEGRTPERKLRRPLLLRPACMLQQPLKLTCIGRKREGVGERAAQRTRRLQREGIEAAEIARGRFRRRASNRARRCYVGARRTRTGRRWLLACLTTCLLMVSMRDSDPDGCLLADLIACSRDRTKSLGHQRPLQIRVVSIEAL